MSCYSEITENVLSCGGERATKGVEERAWTFNANGGITPTIVNNKITDLSGALFSIDGFKDSLTVGAEAVVSATVPTGYKHTLSVIENNKVASARAELDRLDNIGVIVELKGAKTEGCFVAYGVKNGLWRASTANKSSDNNNQFTHEFASMEGQEEVYSRYIVWKTDYATTKALLEGLV